MLTVTVTMDAHGRVEVNGPIDAAPAACAMALEAARKAVLQKAAGAELQGGRVAAAPAAALDQINRLNGNPRG